MLPKRFTRILRRGWTHRLIKLPCTYPLQTSCRRTLSTKNGNENEVKEYNHNFTFLDHIWKDGKNLTTTYDVVLLHCPNDNLIHGLCNHANYVVCADGGANALYRGGDSEITPYAIIGDLDSVDSKVLDYFMKKGTKKVHNPDQNSNDFEKSIRYLLNGDTNVEICDSDYIVCWGAFGGRFDHEMQAFNVIDKLEYKTDHQNIVLMSPNNFGYVLMPGKHNIKCANIQGSICGIIPLHGATTLTTNGFKWDLKNQISQFGGLVSSSNELLSSNIEICNDCPVVFHTVVNIRNDDESWTW